MHPRSEAQRFITIMYVVDPLIGYLIRLQVCFNGTNIQMQRAIVDIPLI